MSNETNPSNAFHSQGAAYDEHSPRSITCPYEFTGNASEEYQDFFKAAYQFGLWASTNDISGAGPSITMKVHGFPDGGYQCGYKDDEWDSSKRILPNTNPKAKYCADGITLQMTEAGWAADVYMHFVELLAVLPTGFPDGDLDIHVGGTADPLLHLWHD